ncbi:hypothetical protein IAT38_002675 [Cryptococcus sp. DSM 104549]
MPRYIPLASLPSHLRPALRPITATPFNPALKSHLPSPTDILLQHKAAAELPANVRVQEFVDDRHRWSGIGTRERLGGKKLAGIKFEKMGRKWGGLKWALRER